MEALIHSQQESERLSMEMVGVESACFALLFSYFATEGIGIVVAYLADVVGDLQSSTKDQC